MEENKASDGCDFSFPTFDFIWEALWQQLWGWTIWSRGFAKSPLQWCKPQQMPFHASLWGRSYGKNSKFQWCLNNFKRAQTAAWIYWFPGFNVNIIWKITSLGSEWVHEYLWYSKIASQKPKLNMLICKRFKSCRATSFHEILMFLHEISGNHPSV